MSNFDKAVQKVLAHEGGYVWHPLDTGGETNLGITRKTLEKYLGYPAGPDAMKNLSRGNAIEIYKSLYWDEVRGDDIKNYGVAFIMFDQAVNRGPRNSIIQAQKAMDIYPDGYLSDEMILRMNNTASAKLIPRLIDESEAAYRRIVERNPSQEVFLAGWLKRVSSNRAYTYAYLESKPPAKTKTSISTSNAGGFSPYYIAGGVTLFTAIAGFIIVRRIRA